MMLKYNKVFIVHDKIFLMLFKHRKFFKKLARNYLLE